MTKPVRGGYVDGDISTSRRSGKCVRGEGGRTHLDDCWVLLAAFYEFFIRQSRIFIPIHISENLVDTLWRQMKGSKGRERREKNVTTVRFW